MGVIDSSIFDEEGFISDYHEIMHDQLLEQEEALLQRVSDLKKSIKGRIQVLQEKKSEKARVNEEKIREAKFRKSQQESLQRLSSDIYQQKAQYSF